MSQSEGNLVNFISMGRLAQLLTALQSAQRFEADAAFKPVSSPAMIPVAALAAYLETLRVPDGRDAAISDLTRQITSDVDFPQYQSPCLASTNPWPPHLLDTVCPVSSSGNRLGCGMLPELEGLLSPSSSRDESPSGFIWMILHQQEKQHPQTTRSSVTAYYVPNPSPPATVLAAAQPIQAAGFTNRIGGVTPFVVTNHTLLVNGVHPAPTATSSSPTESSTSDSGKSDACVGTCSASTMTEPDCLDPCEPGTAVIHEDIVWHKTERGVLVVSVTRRGKTYVGTSMDCTKNEWAPPRLCDSPTSDAESRAPKGRAKRGRGAFSGTPVLGGPTGDKKPAVLSGLMMMNDISPMLSELRNGAKGRRGGGSSGGPPSSPAKEMLLLGAKRKSSSSSGPKPVETDAKRSRSSSRGASSPITTMDPAVPAGSPSLIECPEPNCSKKYRHINGLKYHQSHAHSTDSASSSSGPMAVDEDSNTSEPSAKSEEAPETLTAPFTGFAFPFANLCSLRWSC